MKESSMYESQDKNKSDNASHKSIAFSLVFSVVGCITYVICDLYKLPLFTFYPAVNEFAFGFVKMTEDQGPAMYWYGWIASSALFALAVAFTTTLIGTSKKGLAYLAHLSWLVVWGLVPVLIQSLKYYWTHA